ncbi:MAG TPA: hypothetical protein VJU79_07375 [Candidatus Dormibacteraeota bacterium]|nr:hypothetical protein [Candidatus Dormibacteraeota bacterium]
MSEHAAPGPAHAVESMFSHVPHPRIAERKGGPPGKVKDPLRKGLNGRLALWITNNVGTMYCAYIFSVIGAVGIVASVTNNMTLVLIIGAISGYFLQLVLLPVIIVGQNLQSAAADQRSEETYKDAEAILSECVQLQAHLQAQDKILDDLVTKMRKLAPQA